MRKELTHKTIDKNTLYERVVYSDPNTMTGQQEELDNLIQRFQQSRIVMRVGKTLKGLNTGEKARRSARRSEHKAWMADVRRDPSRNWPHPFYRAA